MSAVAGCAGRAGRAVLCYAGLGWAACCTVPPLLGSHVQGTYMHARLLSALGTSCIAQLHASFLPMAYLQHAAAKPCTDRWPRCSPLCTRWHHG